MYHLLTWAQVSACGSWAQGGLLIPPSQRRKVALFWQPGSERQWSASWKLNQAYAHSRGAETFSHLSLPRPFGKPCPYCSITQDLSRGREVGRSQMVTGWSMPRPVLELSQLEFGFSGMELLILRNPKDCLQVIRQWKTTFSLPFLSFYPLRKGSSASWMLACFSLVPFI